MFEASRRASRGAALLDEKNPGWYRRVDTDRLHMWSVDSCVLGQLYSNYGPSYRNSGFVNGLVQLRVSGGAARYGFMPSLSAPSSLLKRGWCKEIQARKKKEPSISDEMLADFFKSESVHH